MTTTMILVMSKAGSSIWPKSTMTSSVRKVSSANSLEEWQNWIKRHVSLGQGIVLDGCCAGCGMMISHQGQSGQSICGSAYFM